MRAQGVRLPRRPLPEVVSVTPSDSLQDPCSSADDCAAGLNCGNCPASGMAGPSCIRAQAVEPTSIVKGLPFNRYTWLVTHNSFSILGEPSYTGVQRVTFYNQDDTVANQLRNGVRGLMLDMYDFDGDVWLCHSFQGQCYNFTAFEPAINTLKEVESFLSANPTEIVTIIIEDYVHAPMGLSKLFTSADLVKYWYPVSEMPTNGKDWPSVTDMVAKNRRLLVFTSDASKEASEGIAYQWKYLLENEPGDPGIVPGTCPNRKESQALNSRYASLFLQNYFPTIPVENEACKENSVGLAQMVDACYKAAGNQMPNFLAVNFYMRSDGRGVFDIQDRINGLALCGCSIISSCQAGAPMGVCKNTGASNRTPAVNGNIYSGYIQLSGSILKSYSGFRAIKLFIMLQLLQLLL
ncbi:PI-PLC X domain-containing protein At5g67130 isoform X2 [Ananas comosus]|uniref:PI-PLC X domain-containing protein At5g67130 isoform X2 n=1 Tax=Ananas comosus TaxID=4615 RepID=A0A6P5G4V1_ANACO|nr:PI-PLC X domain-containing protein At5g67130 isoform X2 [Ananas comosus]